MTSPGGQSGFEYGPDSVAARLSVEVPPEGIQTLHQLNKEAEALRVNMEALVRAEGQHIDMVRQMADIHNQVANSTRGLTEEVSRLANSNNQVARNGEGISATYWGAPSGTYMDPFSGAGGAGMGRMDMGMGDPRGFLNAQAAQGNLGASELGQVEAAFSQGQIQEIASTLAQGVREGMNQELAAMGMDGSGGRMPGGAGGDGGGQGSRSPGGGRNSPASSDPRDAIARLTGGANLAQQLVGEIGPGGSTEGVGRSMEGVMDLLGGMGGIGGAGGGGIARLAGFAGPVGAGIGATLAAAGLVQAGGEQIQGFKNLGSIQGGGAGDGFGYEMAARGMALNPFISTEQARSVIQAALTDGAKGKTFDKMTDYLANNLKEMNMSVSESMQLVQTNVHEAGESIEGLSTTLAGLKEGSKSSGKSFDEIKQSFTEIAAALSSGGVNQGTNNIAATMANMFPDNKELGNVASKMAGATFSDPYSPGFAHLQASLARTNPALARMSPLAAADAIGRMDPGLVADSMFEQFRGMDADTIFTMARQYGLTAGEAQALAKELAGGKRPGEAANQARKEANTAVNTQSAGSAFWKGLGSFETSKTEVMANVGKNLFGSLSDLVTGNTGNFGNRLDDIRKSFSGAANDVQASARQTSNPILEEMIRQYGPEGIELFNGNQRVNFDANNASQVRALASGQLSLRPKGSTDAPVKLQDAGGKNWNMNVQGQVSGKVDINIKADPRYQIDAPKSIPITGHQERVLGGYRDTTLNDPPPGG